MGTKSDPGTYDCYEKAEPDEPMFILLARDVTAPDLVRRWAHERIKQGMNKYQDRQIAEAFQCADDMETWWIENRIPGVDDE